MGFEARISDRQDLADFLRMRRARLRPTDVGLPNSSRRRTPGLRREEVAQLAGVGVAWYTWLEQGRAVHPSDQVLEGVAHALRLNTSERVHLFRLARGCSEPNRPSRLRSVPAVLDRVLTALDPCPAYVRTARWDVLAWNRSAARFFGDYGSLSDPERNVLRLTFADPAYRTLLVDWEGDARRLMAAFRADYAAAAGDPEFPTLVAELDALSWEFRFWWRQHDVLGCSAGLRAYNHPVIGRIELEYTAFVIADDRDLRMVTHTPLAGSGGEEALSRLSIGK